MHGNMSSAGSNSQFFCATRGEAGILGLKPEEAAAVREQDLRVAVKHLGIEVIFMG